MKMNERSVKKVHESIELLSLLPPHPHEASKYVASHVKHEAKKSLLKTFAYKIQVVTKLRWKLEQEKYVYGFKIECMM